MDDFDDDFCNQLLSDCGFTEDSIDEITYGICCGSPMTPMSELLVCDLCGTIQHVRESPDRDYAKGPMSYQVGKRTFTCYNSEPKSRHDKIADMVNNFKNRIAKRNRSIDSDLLTKACTVMFDITTIHIKKTGNRISLFAALLYYTSINMGQILTQKEIKSILNGEIKFSKGVKIISNALLHEEIQRDKIVVGVKIHNLLLAKYLNIYDPEFYLNDGNINNRNINDNTNRRFCSTMIDFILTRNIAYNAVIHSKCIAVVYYLIKHKYLYDDEKAQKKYFTSIVEVGENTYMKVYQTLIDPMVQVLFRESGKFK